MTFYGGRFAAIAYIWIVLWTMFTVKYYRRDLMPGGDWLSIFAWVSVGVSAVTGLVGALTTAMVNKRVQVLGLTLAFSIVMAIWNFSYVVCVRERALDNFTDAVRHLDATFDLDDPNKWEQVKNQLMIFGIGIDARFGEGIEESVAQHYYHYITQWAAGVVNWFGAAGVIIPIIGMGVTLCLISSLKRALAAEESGESQLVEVPAHQTTYASNLPTEAAPQYVAPPAIFPPAGSVVYNQAQQPIAYDPRFQPQPPYGAQQPGFQPGTTVTVSFPTTTPAAISAPGPVITAPTNVQSASAVVATDLEAGGQLR